MSDLDLAVTPDERAALRAEIAGWETDLGLAETITRLLDALDAETARADEAEAEVRERIAGDIDASSCGCPCCGIAARIARGGQ